MTVLVLGAGGFLGLNVVDALLARGEAPRCGRRRRSNVLGLRARKVDLVTADLDQPAELRAAMAGCDVVIHAAGHYPRFSFDRAGAIATGLRQMRNVLDAVASSGVRRLVYVSSVATAAPAPSGTSDESSVYGAAPGLGTYHDLKWEMERLALCEDRFEVSVACPGACLGPWDWRVGTSALFVALARGLDPRHPDGVINPVDARDVAEALVRMARVRAPPRRVLLAAGNHRLHDLLVSLARRYGVARVSPPMPAGEALRFADAEEQRAAREGGRPALSREIADLVVHGVALDARLAASALGLRFRPLEETLQAADAFARKMRFIPSEVGP
ncbi:MAG TPA: NAD-dependent epimerase/dehydratase family protein [Myxococcales bacterium]|nr:NAD-dependent epimerase/dehydratase family protein [Myxococcales bacterium]